MLVIRFSRVGKKNRAQFRIVVQEHTVAPSGKHVEILGSYDPHFKKGAFKKERIEHWVKNGAQISDSVYNVLVKQGIIKGKKRFIKITAKKEKGKKDGEKPASAPASIKTPADKEVTEGKKEKTEEKKTEKKIEEGAKKEKPASAEATEGKKEKTEEVKKEEKKKGVKNKAKKEKK